MKTKVFEVQDWAGNVMNWGDFETFDDAWSEIMARIEDENEQGEYYAIEKGA